MMWRGSRHAFAGAMLAGVAACDGSRPDLTGTWAGTLPGAMCSPVLGLTLTESSRGIITGTGSLTAPPSCGFGGVISYSVSGEHDHPSVTMTLQSTMNGGVVVIRTLEGNVEGADAINATLDGSAITLARLQTP